MPLPAKEKRRAAARRRIRNLAARGAGAGLVVLAAGLGLGGHAVVREHGAGALACAAMLLAFMALSTGLALLVEGAGLFGTVPMPPRSFLK